MDLDHIYLSNFFYKNRCTVTDTSSFTPSHTSFGAAAAHHLVESRDDIVACLGAAAAPANGEGCLLADIFVVEEDCKGTQKAGLEWILLNIHGFSCRV